MCIQIFSCTVVLKKGNALRLFIFWLFSFCLALTQKNVHSITYMYLYTVIICNRYTSL